MTVGAWLACACASAIDGSDGSELEGGGFAYEQEYEDGRLAHGENVEGGPLSSGGDASGEDVSGEDVSSEVDRGEPFASAEETLGSDGELGTLQQGLGGDCGSNSSAASALFKAVAVPDHFPPDSPLAQLSAVAIGVPLAATLGCAAFGIASMDPTCDVHDACYGEFGATQSSCDSAAREGWERACKNTYDEFAVEDGLIGLIPVIGPLLSAAELAEQACRTACLGMAKLMFEAVSQGGRSAFEAAQVGAAPSPSPQGPIFF